jgi:alcohol dehydrogenase class IV
MTFEFATATRIVFGEGKRSELFAAAQSFGTPGLLVTGANPARAEWVREGLGKVGVEVELFTFPAEPTLERVEEGRRIARASGARFVIGVGGGSAIDGGKAIAALATNEGEIGYYLEVIGGGKPLATTPLPFLAVPTTAGTGAEVTRNAVLLSPEHQLKVSLRSLKMLPALAIVDPELTYHLPPLLTASTGMDALTQLIEPFLCSRANPLVDALCREAIPRVVRALPIAFREPHNTFARAEMALGSLFGGMALANAGLGAVHGFAAPIGGMFEAPHGAVCAALLPAVMEVNHRALLRREKNSRTLKRFWELGHLVVGHRHADAEDAISHLRALVAELKIPSLDAYRIAESHVPLLCSRAAQTSSMKANPVTLTQEELAEILTRSL